MTLSQIAATRIPNALPLGWQSVFYSFRDTCAWCVTPVAIMFGPGIMTWGFALILQAFGMELLPYLASDVVPRELAKYITGLWWLVGGVSLSVFAFFDKRSNAEA